MLTFVLVTSARLLRLLALLQARRYWAGPELAERLGITERTVRRDIERLRSLGYPVHGTSGVAGGYQLGSGASLPPLQLEDDEAVAVAIGLRTAASGTVSGIEEPAVRALAKLERVLPSRLRHQIQALHAFIVPLRVTGPSVDPTVLTLLAAACRDHQCVHFKYGDSQAHLSERRVEPHGLVHTGYRWYLVAWDVTREAFRTFRVDRIANKPETGSRFLPRPLPEADLASYVSRSVAASVYTFQARVILHAPLESIRERLSPSEGLLEKISDQRCRLTTGAHSLESIGLWIAMLAVDFEIEHPPELRDHLRTLASRLAKASRTAERS
jgi:predicted DNA-binding transcriptional regulator YafY